MHLEEKEQEEDIDQIKKYNVVQKKKGAGSFLVLTCENVNSNN